MLIPDLASCHRGYPQSSIDGAYGGLQSNAPILGGVVAYCNLPQELPAESPSETSSPQGSTGVARIGGWVVSLRTVADAEQVWLGFPAPWSHLLFSLVAVSPLTSPNHCWRLVSHQSCPSLAAEPKRELASRGHSLPPDFSPQAGNYDRSSI